MRNLCVVGPWGEDSALAHALGRLAALLAAQLVLAGNGLLVRQAKRLLLGVGRAAELFATIGSRQPVCALAARRAEAVAAAPAQSTREVP